MSTEKTLTDSEKLDDINKRIKRMEISTYIHTAVVIIGFLGVVSLGVLVDKLKTKLK